ncbi:Protein of unknown function [Bacillus cytotoxicus]|nr:Protein of unknown function [Bacillus cytotoxicus]
MDLITSQKAY